jgi:hypothetical protein
MVRPHRGFIGGAFVARGGHNLWARGDGAAGDDGAAPRDVPIIEHRLAPVFRVPRGGARSRESEA